MPAHAGAIDIPSDVAEDELKELASLARLVTFARERAREINAEFPAYCLDLALGAILQDMEQGTSQAADLDTESLAGMSIARGSQLPN